MLFDKCPFLFHTAVVPGVPGVPWHPKILADQLTISQPGGTDYDHLITTNTPRFSELPTALCLRLFRTIEYLDEAKIGSCFFHFYLYLLV